jgi:hypothetical protein
MARKTSMKLKLDDAGHVVLSEGKPVVIHDDGKEIAFDIAGTVQTISRLNAEAKSHRERAEAAEARYKPFEGIEDAAAARKALDTVKSLEQKKLIDAGEVELVKAEITKALQSQIEQATGRAQQLEQQLYAEKIGGAFARSPLIVGDKAKLAIPADMVQARFGNSFKIEDGKVVAYDNSGNKIFSRSRPGEIADFDEALDVLVDMYPHKDHILRSSGATGSGAGPAAGGAPSRQAGDFGGSKADRVAAIAAKFDLPKG